MGHYGCGGCGRYEGSCTCYHHNPSRGEQALEDKAYSLRLEMTRIFSDWVRGYSLGNFGDTCKMERTEVSSLDVVKLNVLKAVYLLAMKEKEAIYKEEYAAGKARHEARIEEDKKAAAEEERRSALREIAIEALFDEMEPQNENHPQ